MLDFLRTIFGANISLIKFDYPENAPYYIRDGYTLSSLVWDKNQCVLLTPSVPSWRLPTIKKQLMKFQEICPFPCALCLKSMTALQRRSLVESNIPFVSFAQQVYLPFWGCLFTERFKAQMSVPDQMAPGTQLVFLYLYYQQDTTPVNLTWLSKHLLLSKATCTRAVYDLTASGLITQKNEGTTKWIIPAFEKPEFLGRAYPRLKSPVERCIYVKRLEKDSVSVKSGICALADVSRVGADERDGAVPVSKKQAADIPAEDMISWQDFQSFGGFIVEVWSYDPALLAKDGRVDDISLLLSLQNDPDERIQMGLDEIRKVHGLPIQSEE